MMLSTIHRGIISDQAGLWTRPLRLALRAASGVYSLAVKVRNARYDRGEGVCAVSVPVISVGNITVGGTGKTPMVIDLVERLRRLKRRPAVVARGFKAQKDHPGDEELLIRRRNPGVCYVADPNRVAGAKTAVRAGADVIVLDDGFQHRAIARDLDIVLIDATLPFGFDHVLPRGLLREPIRGLQRADLIIVTRCSDVTREVLAELHECLARMARGCGVLSCIHRPVAITRVDGTTLADNPHTFLRGKNVVTFCGLAQHQAFERTVSSLGANLVAVRRWADHHAYCADEINLLLNDRHKSPVDLFVTSEKDAVKLVALTDVDLNRIVVVNVAIDFAGEDGTILDELLERTLRRGETS